MLEQNIICQDMDDKDRDSIHCFFANGNRVVAYLRAFYSGKDTVTIGRVLTLVHGQGLGSELMRKGIDEIKKRFTVNKICVHSQKQAENFYKKIGFNTVSGEYLEEGVVHINMEMQI